MRALVQRVSSASVRVDGAVVGQIERGLLVLLGASHGDGSADVAYLAKKIAGLRVFEDDGGKMNLALDQLEPAGDVLVVSQFTLYGDTRKGRRPSFVGAMAPEPAEALVDEFVDTMRARGFRCPTGVFGAHMEVSLVNDGPVTLLIESHEGAGVGPTR